MKQPGSANFSSNLHKNMKNFPKNTTCTVLSFLLLLSTGCATGLVRKADSNLKEGNYRKAAELYAPYLKKHPGAFLSRRNYGLALLKSGQPEKAATQFGKALDYQPHDYRSFLYLGLAYLQLGDYQETLDVWRQYKSGGKPLIVQEVEWQSQRLNNALPGISNELASEIKSAIEGAIQAQELRRSYKASRLEECVGGG